MADEAMTKFGQSLRGRLIHRGDTDYDGARTLYNGMIDKRPLMIARPVDVADVITAVNYGRDNNSSSPSAAAGTTVLASGAATTAW